MQTEIGNEWTGMEARVEEYAKRGEATTCASEIVSSLRPRNRLNVANYAALQPVRVLARIAANGQ
jgi:hypothetical protein